MDCHIPNGGLHNAVAGAAGEAHQLGQAWVVAPQAYPQQAVLQCLAHPAQGPAAPSHRIAELLEFDQVDGPVAAEHQAQLGIGRRAKPVPFPVEAGEELGGGHDCRVRRNQTILPDGRFELAQRAASPRSCRSASWA